MKNPREGQKVTVKTNDGGEFDATIVDVFDHHITVEADDPKVRQYLGGRKYRIGSAHWTTVLKERQ